MLSASQSCVHFTYVGYPICTLLGCACPGSPQCGNYKPRVAIQETKPGLISKVVNGNLLETHGNLLETHGNSHAAHERGWPKRCRQCGTLFIPASNRQVRCPECKREHRRSYRRRYMAAWRKKHPLIRRARTTTPRCGISPRLFAAYCAGRFELRELAERTGLHYATISQLIHGYQKPRLDDPRVIALGRVLGLGPGECFAS